jgi:hypothetical protein
MVSVPHTCGHWLPCRDRWSVSLTHVVTGYPAEIVGQCPSHMWSLATLPRSLFSVPHTCGHWLPCRDRWSVSLTHVATGYPAEIVGQCPSHMWPLATLPRSFPVLNPITPRKFPQIIWVHEPHYTCICTYLENLATGALNTLPHA